MDSIQEWIQNGRPIPPPPLFKQQIVRLYAKRHRVKTLIETGTYLGAMLAANKNNFNEIISIELDEELYQRASRRFENDKHITIYRGNSGVILPVILKNITEPCLFWLDGHYSEGITARGDKDTPIKEELAAILSHGIKQHVILIDDARCFNGENQYPTIKELTEEVINRGIYQSIAIADDIIRISR